MNNWYVMRTIPTQEEQAVALMLRRLDHSLWKQCRILTKQKLFRTQGRLILNTEKMFPGYIFIETGQPEALQRELQKAGKFPQLIGNQKAELVAVESEELNFLQNMCGKNLQQEMGLSEIQVDEEGNITRVKGVLCPYAGQIVRKRLRKRYVLAEVSLFQRSESIFFGILLPDDRISDENCKN